MIGPDPAEVASRIESLSTEYAKFKKLYAKHGPEHKAVIKVREDVAAIFVTFKSVVAIDRFACSAATEYGEFCQGS